MRVPACLVFLAVALSLPFPSSVRAQPTTGEAKTGPTLLVMPAEALGARATAIQLRLMGALRAAGGTNLVHQKTLYRVQQRYEARLASLTPDQRVQTLGRVVGADLVITSALEDGDAGSTLTVSAVPVDRGDEATSSQQSFQGKTWFEALGQVPSSLPDLVSQTGRGRLAGSVQGPVVPITENAEALLEYASCSSILLRQPMGISNPVVLDRDSISEARDRCQDALKTDGDFPDAKAALALAEAYLGRQTAAERLLAQVKDVEAFIPTYWLAKFWVLSRYYDTELALVSLRESLKRFPGFLLGRGYLGEALMALKQPEEAKQVFESYLAQAPRQSWVMGQIGYVHAKMGNLEEAISWTERALRTTPSDPELLLQLASRFIDAKRYEEATVLLRRVISEGGARGEVHLRLGYAYLKLGRFNDAEQQMVTAINKAERAAEWRTRGRARYNLAQLWIEAGSPGNALRQLRMAVREGFRDERAIKSSALAPLKKEPGYAQLLASKPRRGIAPDFVSPLGRATDTGELELKESSSQVSKKILDKF